MKRRIIALLALAAILAMPATVMAEDLKTPAELGVLESPTDTPNPSYFLKWEYEEETGALIDETLVFPDGTADQPDDNYIMLMTDGSFYSNKIILSGAAALLPIGAIAEEHGAAVKWDANTKTASFVFPEGGTLTVQAGSKYATLKGEDIILDTPAQIANGRMYVIAAVVAETLGSECGIFQENETFAKFPILWLNAKAQDQAETKEAAAEGAKKVLDALFAELDEKYGTIDGQPVNLGIEATKARSGSPIVSGEISRYWIMSDKEGNDIFLRDKYNGSVFVFRGNYGSYWIEPLTVDSLYYCFFTQ